MINNARPIPILDSVLERRRHHLWRRVAELRAELLTEPSAQTHHELGAALAQLHAFDSIASGKGSA